MDTAQITLRPKCIHSDRQRSVRRHSSGLSLRRAVRSAVNVFFHFDRRATHGTALWSETERVWMGSQTFLYWAIRDAEIDIPWAVATASDAPEDVDLLREAVRVELLSYWKNQIASLPRRVFPRWLPLP